MKKLCSFIFDFSRVVANMNEFMIVVNYFDESSPQIKRTVYQILEQNHTSGLEAFNSLKNQLLNYVTHSFFQKYNNFISFSETR